MSDYRAWRRFLVLLTAGCVLLVVVGCDYDGPVNALPQATTTPQPPPTQSFLPVAPVTSDPGLAEAFPDVDEDPPVQDTDLPDASALDAPAAAVEELSPTATPTVTALTEAPAAVAASATYTVRPGDTLMGIAMKFGVPMAAIQLANDMGAEITVWVEQQLTIPQGGIWADASPFWSVYEVVAGDTLGEVAAHFGLDVEALLMANGLSDGDLIAVGQPLILPIDTPIDALAAAPPTTAPPAPTPEPTAPPASAAVSIATAGDAQLFEGAQAGGADEAVEVVAPDPTPTVVPDPIAEESPATSPAVQPPDTSALASEIYRRINEQRAAYGLPALAWNGILAQAAQLHADDCYARGWCGHTGSDGSTYKARIIRAGYNPVRWSECWAWYGTPERAVAMWMDEVPPNDPHRRTILSDYLTEVGVGVVPGNGHGYYFIADFGTPGN